MKQDEQLGLLRPFPEYSYVVRVDPDGPLHVHSAGDSIRDITGYGLEDLRGPDAWHRLIRPDQLDRVREGVAQLLDSGEWSGALEIVTKSGAIRKLHAYARVEVEPPRQPPRWIYGYARDLDALSALQQRVVEAERRLDMLVGQIPAVMWAIDRDLRFLSSQGSALELLGLEPDGVVGMTLYDYFGTEDPDYLPIAQHYRALSGESVVYDFEWEGHSFQCLCAPRFDTAGRITGALGVAVVSEWSGMTLGETPEEVITAGPLRLMVDSYSAELGDRALKLTPTEFKLLQEFARNQGVVLSRDVLLKQVWGYEFLGGSRVVDMAVKRLRDKLEEQSGGALVVETVRGVGYKLEV